ncbi:hypothetical protein F3Y22_tig00005712pilonHSYRG00048 [Hibiscus syriacus]|uniref:Uncharacterized protein n=1 Tax=Hibiscus syriacus TaxID=106335 RepID=A0A6A3CIG1_HIBSY|nr:hypothetical protein F3Y22_tig00005712pilonHSYRG00048 [Hibiscus syriacus]
MYPKSFLRAWDDRNGASIVYVLKGVYLLGPVVFSGPCRGGGTFDGQVPFAWQFNTCTKDINCKPLPISLKCNSMTNFRIEYLRSVNSKQTHISFLRCENVNVSNVEVLAPSDSPSTDGIKMRRSTDIRISNNRISTGDDCVAILCGSSNIDVFKFRCSLCSFECSKKFPCKNIVLPDINFVNSKREVSLKSLCSNVIGRSFGLQSLLPCF